MNQLLSLDHQLLFFINQRMRNGVFDFLCPVFHEKYTWVPLYVIMLAFVFNKFKNEKWLITLFAILTVALTDQMSSSVIKPITRRLRPCNAPGIMEHVHLIIGCGPGYSFVSSHAANSFGIAFFFISFLHARYKWFTPVAIIWASAVSVSQVYLGLHYPSDAFAGALLGMLMGYFSARLCKFILHRMKASA